jgi:hypothetical protein
VKQKKNVWLVTNNISVISWLSVLLVEETGVAGENYWSTTSQLQTLSHNVVSSTPYSNLLWHKKNPSTLWSYIWIYNYLCNQCLSPLTLWVRIHNIENKIHYKVWLIKQFFLFHLHNVLKDEFSKWILILYIFFKPWISF